MSLAPSSQSAKSADSRVLLKVLQTLWHQRCQLPADESRPLRLTFMSEILARPVGTAKELKPPDLRRVIDALRDEQRTRDRKAGLRAATREQLFAIRRLEQEIGWAPRPERLEGFLEKMFRVHRAPQLTAAQASKCIEALKAIQRRSDPAGSPPHPVAQSSRTASSAD